MSNLEVVFYSWPGRIKTGWSRQYLAEQLAASVSGTPMLTTMAKRIVSQLLSYAAMSAEQQQQMREDYPNGSVPPSSVSAGRCLHPYLRERDNITTDPTAPVLPGDIVQFVYRGAILPAIKVFVAQMDRDRVPHVVFYQANPGLLVELPLDDLLYVEKIEKIQRGNAPAFTADGRGILERPIRWSVTSGMYSPR